MRWVSCANLLVLLPLLLRSGHCSVVRLREGTTLPTDWREQLLSIALKGHSATTEGRAAEQLVLQTSLAARKASKRPPPPVRSPSPPPPPVMAPPLARRAKPPPPELSPPLPPPPQLRPPQQPLPSPPGAPTQPASSPRPPPPRESRRRSPSPPHPGLPSFPQLPSPPPRLPSPPPPPPLIPSPPPPPPETPSPPPPAPRSPRNRPPPPPPPAPPTPLSLDVWPGTPPTKWSTLPTYEQVTFYLEDRVARSGGLCSLSSIGQSAQGRELWLVTAGNPTAPVYADPDNPEISFPKPAAAYIGSMHGDEQSNMLVLLQFLSEVCTGQLDERQQNLLATTTVYVIPMMNPDGYSRGTRWNANGMDLNRNAYNGAFPYARPNPSTVAEGLYPEAAFFLLYGGTAMEPETVAVTSWLKKVRPAVSANLHGGALVASYAMDACDSLGANRYCPSPEAPLPRLLAFVYSQNHPVMRANMRDVDRVSLFENGTTLGSKWYTALGTLGDWAHADQQMHMVTLELHIKKTPSPGDDLVNMYNQNRASLLRFAEMAHLGLRSRLLDADTGAPLQARVVLDQPSGMWPPAVESGGYIWKLGAPGLQYTGTIIPFDANNPSVQYNSIPFSFSIPSAWNDVLKGTGTTGLSVVRTFRARRAAR